MSSSTDRRLNELEYQVAELTKLLHTTSSQLERTVQIEVDILDMMLRMVGGEKIEEKELKELLFN